MKQKVIWLKWNKRQKKALENVLIGYLFYLSVLFISLTFKLLRQQVDIVEISKYIILFKSYETQGKVLCKPEVRACSVQFIHF